ncbi:hypothetical protein [uncultured Shewanella sp.]|uniref:hypothetical protein n=1 Tax=uncultured Shewanella sp. TaxID=173975 RepID=UPI002604647D|nr:hypothetical protein [uncultured Shewanella sp.]
MKGGVFLILFMFSSILVYAKPLIKLEPKVRIHSKQVHSPMLELALIRPYLSQNIIVTPHWLEAQPKVIGSDEPSVLYRENNTLYIDGVLPKGALLGIFQQGREFELSHSAHIEQEMILAASAVVIHSSAISAVKVLSSFREVRLGDVASIQSLPIIMPSYFMSDKSQLNSSASIIASEAQRTAMGVMDVVYLNQGRSQGVETGQLLSVFTEGESVALIEQEGVVPLSQGTAYDKMVANYHWDPWFVLPSVEVGKLMVFRVFDNMSFGIIMENTRPIRVGDSVGNH